FDHQLGQVMNHAQGLAAQPLDELRADDLTVRDRDQFLVLFLKIDQRDFSERLQTRSETALQSARAVRHSTQFARFTREEDANLVGFLDRKCAKNEGVCFVQRHKIRAGRSYVDVLNIYSEIEGKSKRRQSESPNRHPRSMALNSRAFRFSNFSFS